MADYAKIKRNIQKMIDQNAPEADIDAYVSSEGVTAEELRAAPKAQTLSAPLPPLAAMAPGPDGQRMTEQEMADFEARSAAKQDQFGGNQTLQTLYRDFAEPWIPNGGPDFSERGIPERLADAGSFAASLPVRMFTGGKYGAGDLASGLGAESIGQSLGAGETDFLMNNRKQLKTIANAGDLAMGLGTPAPSIKQAFGMPRSPIPSGGTIKVPVVPPSMARRLAGGPRGAAEQRTITAMEDAGMTPQSVIQSLDAGQAAAKFKGNQAALPETLMDLLGDPGIRALRGATVKSPAASAIAKERFTARRKGTVSPYENRPASMNVGETQKTFGQRDRLLDDFARAAEIKTAGSAYMTGRQLRMTQKKESGPVYREAFSEGVAEDFDIRPAITKAMEEAADMDNTRGAAMKQAIQMFQYPLAPMSKRKHFRPLGRADELKRFDSNKRGLDDMIRKFRREGQNEMVAALTRFKNNLLDDVHGGDRSNPTKNVRYSEAREIFSGSAALQDALEMGRKAFKMDGEEFAGEMANMTKAQQKASRIGVHSAMKQNMNNPDGGDYTQWLRKPNTAATIKAALPQYTKSAETKPSAQFGELVRREARMAEGENFILYGTKTADKIEDAGDLAGWTRITQRLRNNGMWSTVVDEVTEAFVKTFSMTRATAREVAKIMTESDPQKIRAMMQKLEQQLGEGAADDAYKLVLQVTRNKLRAATAAGVGARGVAVGYGPESRR